MHRRQIIATLCSLPVGVVVSGCSYFNDRHQQESIPIDVHNGWDEVLTIDLTVLSNSGVMFEHRYEMEPGSGDQTQSIQRTPTEIHLGLNESQSEEFEYNPPRDCVIADDDPRITLMIYEPDDVTLTYGCAW
ncbi:hypothetical protein JCM18750_27890 [Halostagnicola bangensis]